MKSISVKAITGEYAVSMSSGHKLKSIILSEGFPQEKVTLDFHGVTICCASYFNASLAHLVMKYELNTVISQISVINLNQYSKHILNVCIENALTLKQKNS